jgi:hypothetical protein
MMRGLFAIAAIMIVCTAGVSAAGAQSSETQPTGGLVAGSGSTAFGFSVEVGAHGTPASGAGELIERSASSVYVASVDCVLVFGNSALVVGTLKKPEGVFTKLVAEFVDNGNGAHAAPDEVVSGLAEGTFDNCHPSLVDFSDAFPVVHGNFVVHGD